MLAPGVRAGTGGTEDGVLMRAWSRRAVGREWWAQNYKAHGGRLEGGIGEAAQSLVVARSRVWPFGSCRSDLVVIAYRAKGVKMWSMRWTI